MSSDSKGVLYSALFCLLLALGLASFLTGKSGGSFANTFFCLVPLAIGWCIGVGRARATQSSLFGGGMRGILFGFSGLVLFLALLLLFTAKYGA